MMVQEMESNLDESGRLKIGGSVWVVVVSVVGALLLIAYKAWEVVEGTSQMFPAGGEFSRGEGLTIIAIAGIPFVAAGVLLVRRHWLLPWVFAAFHGFQVLVYLHGITVGDYRPGGGWVSAAFFLYVFQSQRVRLTFGNRPLSTVRGFGQNVVGSLVVGLASAIIAFEGTGLVVAFLREFTPLELAWYTIVHELVLGLLVGGSVGWEMFKGGREAWPRGATT